MKPTYRTVDEARAAIKETHAKLLAMAERFTKPLPVKQRTALRGHLDRLKKQAVVAQDYINTHSVIRKEQVRTRRHVPVVDPKVVRENAAFRKRLRIIATPEARTLEDEINEVMVAKKLELDRLAARKLVRRNNEEQALRRIESGENSGGFRGGRKRRSPHGITNDFADMTDEQLRRRLRGSRETPGSDVKTVPIAERGIVSLDATFRLGLSGTAIGKVQDVSAKPDVAKAMQEVDPVRKRIIALRTEALSAVNEANLLRQQASHAVRNELAVLDQDAERYEHIMDRVGALEEEGRSDERTHNQLSRLKEEAKTVWHPYFDKKGTEQSDGRLQAALELIKDPKRKVYARKEITALRRQAMRKDVSVQKHVSQMDTLRERERKYRDTVLRGTVQAVVSTPLGNVGKQLPAATVLSQRTLRAFGVSQQQAREHAHDLALDRFASKKDERETMDQAALRDRREREAKAEQGREVLGWKGKVEIVPANPVSHTTDKPRLKLPWHGMPVAKFKKLKEKGKLKPVPSEVPAPKAAKPATLTLKDKLDLQGTKRNKQAAWQWSEDVPQRPVRVKAKPVTVRDMVGMTRRANELERKQAQAQAMTRLALARMAEEAYAKKHATELKQARRTVAVAVKMMSIDRDNIKQVIAASGPKVVHVKQTAKRKGFVRAKARRK